MPDITATELELLGCFGVEPRLFDASVPWCYNDSVYKFAIGDLAVSFAIQPACRDVRLIVYRGGTRLFEFNAVSVDDVRVIDKPGVDAVVVEMTEESWLRLQIRPVFEITQGFARGALHTTTPDL